MSGCLALGGAAASGQWAQEGTPRAAVDSGRRRRAAQGERQRLKPAAFSRAVGRRLPAGSPAARDSRPSSVAVSAAEEARWPPQSPPGSAFSSLLLRKSQDIPGLKGSPTSGDSYPQDV